MVAAVKVILQVPDLLEINVLKTSEEEDLNIFLHKYSLTPL